MGHSRVIFLAVCIFLIAIFWAVGGYEISDQAPYYIQRALGKSATVAVRDQVLKVEVERSDRAKAKGLSERRTLGYDRGMLFLFDAADTHTFTMRDMRFALDIVWIADGRIAEVSRNVPAPKANEAPVLVKPSVPVTTVLEVRAGAAATWVVGDAVSITYHRFLHYSP